ncbi:MAG: hypothetical protein HXN83_02605 [Prevotella pallens]|nr:hypothetical protein [Prevotella pallens]
MTKRGLIDWDNERLKVMNENKRRTPFPSVRYHFSMTDTRGRVPLRINTKVFQSPVIIKSSTKLD